MVTVRYLEPCPDNSRQQIVLLSSARVILFVFVNNENPEYYATKSQTAIIWILELFRRSISEGNGKDSGSNGVLDSDHGRGSDIRKYIIQRHCCRGWFFLYLRVIRQIIIGVRACSANVLQSGGDLENNEKIADLIAKAISTSKHLYVPDEQFQNMSSTSYIPT